MVRNEGDSREPMNYYTVKTVNEPVDWDLLEKAELRECSWSPNPAPSAYMQAAFLPGSGLIVHIESSAAPSRSENFEPDSPVWDDSCLEFFFSAGGKEYVNLEANSNAALRASIGEARHGRKLLLSAGYTMPQVSAVAADDSWQVFFYLPCKSFEELFDVSLTPGSEIRANFYSCGDKTPYPHYASWNPVETDSPDFHRPEFFGRLIIE